MKKLKISSEVAYILGLTIMALSVSMTAAADFGISMIVAPAYILSLKVEFLTFGQAEYVVQGLLFIVFCIIMRKPKPIYLCAFVTGLIYGGILDGWRATVPHFNPNITVPGELPLPIKIIYFVFGMVMTSFAVAMLFRTYIYPQVYDFFVKGVSERYELNRSKFKIGFDFSFLLISCIMTLILFGSFRGIGIGTIIMTVCNGVIIGFFDKLFDKYVEFVPLAPKFSKLFDI